jgi:hypothetical protein
MLQWSVTAQQFILLLYSMAKEMATHARQQHLYYFYLVTATAVCVTASHIIFILLQSLLYA